MNFDDQGLGAALLIGVWYERVRGSLIVPLLLVALGACGGVVNSPPLLSEPVRVRPAGVPSSAQWGGGIDGGAWISCVAGPDEGCVFNCQVFAEDGASQATGRFTFVSQPQAAPPPGRAPGLCEEVSLAQSPYLGWDGQQILLEGGAALRPADALGATVSH